MKSEFDDKKLYHQIVCRLTAVSCPRHHDRLLPPVASVLALLRNAERQEKVHVLLVSIL